MAEKISTTKRYAVVTGANKGLGFEICRQLASKGILVLLTARDEKKGLEALEKLKSDGLFDHVVFFQLDVVDPSSIASLADFIKSKFGRLDILGRYLVTTKVSLKLNTNKAFGLYKNNYNNNKRSSWLQVLPSYDLGGDISSAPENGFPCKVNNAGISGVVTDWDALKSTDAADPGLLNKWKEVMTQNYELTDECLQTNYYGAKRMIEALIPLLELSDSPRIVNVSSGMGKLKNIPSEWAKGVLNDAESLTEERIDEVLNKFLKDFKEGSLESKGWPTLLSAYTLSKAAMNAYTRFLAKKYPTFRINCVCPGYVKTDINNNNGILSTEQGAECPVKLTLLPDEGPSGLFFVCNELSSFE
ncbi:unnamed protein product [Camellia sinensis]